MRCIECGRTLPEDAQFCAHCGARIGALTRARELVRLARTAGLAGTSSGTGEVPPIPDPAPIPLESPSIPDPALLPDEEQAAADLAALTAAHETQLSPRAQEALEEKRREAAAALAGAAAAEHRERMPEQRELADSARAWVPTPAPPPPPPPPEPGIAELEHVSIADLVQAREQEAQVEAAEEERAEISGSRCCLLGCLALGVIFFVLALIGFLARAA